jgi:hypothetical protein
MKKRWEAVSHPALLAHRFFISFLVMMIMYNKHVHFFLARNCEHTCGRSTRRLLAITLALFPFTLLMPEYDNVNCETWSSFS